MSANKAHIGCFLVHLMKRLKTVKSTLQGESDTFHGTVFGNSKALNYLFLKVMSADCHLNFLTE